MFAAMPVDAAQLLIDFCVSNEIVPRQLDPKKYSIDDCKFLIQSVTTLLYSCVPCNAVISAGYIKILLFACNALAEDINKKSDSEFMKDIDPLLPILTNGVSQLSVHELRTRFSYLTMLTIMFPLESLDPTIVQSLREYALSKFSNAKRSQVFETFLIPLDLLLSQLLSLPEQLNVAIPLEEIPGPVPLEQLLSFSKSLADLLSRLHPSSSAYFSIELKPEEKILRSGWLFINDLKHLQTTFSENPKYLHDPIQWLADSLRRYHAVLIECKSEHLSAVNEFLGLRREYVGEVTNTQLKHSIMRSTQLNEQPSTLRDNIRSNPLLAASASSPTVRSEVATATLLAASTRQVVSSSSAPTSSDVPPSVVGVNQQAKRY